MDNNLYRMQFLANLITEEEYIKRSNEINLKNNIDNISTEITRDITKGIKGKKIILNYNLRFESANIPVKVIIKNDIKLKDDFSVIGYASPNTRSITATISVNSSRINSSSQKLKDEINILIWHELKHISQFHNRNQKKLEVSPQPRNIDYYLHPDEVEAYAEELKIKSELSGINIEKIILKFQDSIIDWVNRSIQNKITKGGYSEKDAIKYTGSVKDVETFISQIKIYLNKNYNLKLK